MSFDSTTLQPVPNRQGATKPKEWYFEGGVIAVPRVQQKEKESQAGNEEADPRNQDIRCCHQVIRSMVGLYNVAALCGVLGAVHLLLSLFWHWVFRSLLVTKPRAVQLKRQVQIPKTHLGFSHLCLLSDLCRCSYTGACRRGVWVSDLSRSNYIGTVFEQSPKEFQLRVSPKSVKWKYPTKDVRRRVK